MSDLIDREQTYEVLTDYFHQRTEIQHIAMREALSRVPSAERWIPCKERLPEKDGKYLVTVDIKWTGTDLDFRPIVARFTNGVWMTYFFDVIAWMPLPAPYKGE